MCDCIKTMNDRLADHNGMLVTTLFGTPKVAMRPEKIESRKRVTPPMVIASYCPFCGDKYEPTLRAAATQEAGRG